jgi:hypothetical protein
MIEDAGCSMITRQPLAEHSRAIKITLATNMFAAFTDSLSLPSGFSFDL